MHTILFSGHMIDTSDRKSSRFPAVKETFVRSEIVQHLKKIKSLHPTLKGIAAAASGGDILFHEACMALDIPSEIFLALPIDEFMQNSVSFAGPDWEKRYKKLVGDLPVHIYTELENCENIWAAANSWMLTAAANNGWEQMTLLALWDEKKGDGDGGAEHMVKIAREREAEIIIIDIE